MYRVFDPVVVIGLELVPECVFVNTDTCVVRPTGSSIGGGERGRCKWTCCESTDHILRMSSSWPL